MPTLKAFPPSNLIGAGVRFIEKDQSLISPDQSFHRAGLVGFASKGPFNIPTTIATRRELNITFGYPHPEVGDPYLIYAGQLYLNVANELIVVRVGVTDPSNDEQAVIAEIEVPSNGGLVRVCSDTAGPYTFAEDSFFRWRLNGVLASHSLVVLAGTYTTAELVTELNDQITTEDGITTYASDDDQICVRSTWAYGTAASFEFVSTSDAIYGGTVVLGNVTGLGTGMTQAAVTGTNTAYPTTGYSVAGVWDFTGVTNLNLQIVIDGTDNQQIDDIVQVVDLENLENQSNTTAEVVAEINSQITAATIPGGFTATATGNAITLTTDHHGRDAKLLVKSDSSAEAIFGLATTTNTGTSPSGVTGAVNQETFGITTGPANATGAVTFTITADTAGIDGNNTQAIIVNNTQEGNFEIQVFNNGFEVESWGGLVKDTTSSLYVETYINTISDWIRIEDDTTVSASPADGTYALAGGIDGIPQDADDQDTLLIGSALDSSGIYALADPEQIDIDLVAIPGHSSTTVVLALIDLCENYRGDCLAIIDPPFGLSVQEIVHWQNGTHTLNSTRFDSSMAALFWPWLKIRDTFNKVDVWIPPSGAVLATIARSDQISAPWFAPAGLNRGIVPEVTDVFTRPTTEERNLLYGSRNTVNPIVQFPDIEGFVIWGQKTMQRVASALDRINVRRLMFDVEKSVRSASRELLFDPHDDEFRSHFVQIATEILEEIQIGRGLTDFFIDASTELNTPDVIDRNEFRARIGVQPTRAAEFIFIEFSVHRTGSFTENADTF